MTSDILLHPVTAAQVTRFIRQPSSTLLLAGPDGIGKTYLAEHILSELLGVDVSALRIHPYFYAIAPDSNHVITIDSIRGLRQSLRLKTLGKRDVRRGVLVEHAQAMTQEAQNAFLKLLEEPPLDTIIILTAHNKRSLLPTITSRVQQLAMHVPAEEDLKRYLSSSPSKLMTIDQAYLLSGGLPGLMSALLQEDATHPLVSAVQAAKNLLRLSSFERYIEVDALSKKKDEAEAVATALQHIALTGIRLTSLKNDRTRLMQWYRIFKAAVIASKAFHYNANTKLILCELVARLS